MRGHLTNKKRYIKINLRGIFHQAPVMKRLLMLKQTIMHLPELPLRRRPLGCFRRMLGVRMHVDEWEVAKDKTE